MKRPPDAWHWFGFEYRMDDGSAWTFNLMAQSQEDAETRLRCIGENGRVTGRVICEIADDKCRKCAAVVPLVGGLCPACRIGWSQA